MFVDDGNDVCVAQSFAKNVGPPSRNLPSLVLWRDFDGKMARAPRELRSRSARETLTSLSWPAVRPLRRAHRLLLLCWREQGGGRPHPLPGLCPRSAPFHLPPSRDEHAHSLGCLAPAYRMIVCLLGWYVPFRDPSALTTLLAKHRTGKRTCRAITGRYYRTFGLSSRCKCRGADICRP